MITEAVLGVEEGEDAFEKEEFAFRIFSIFFDVFLILSFFLTIEIVTYASVCPIAKICRLHESLLTANQVPSRLNDKEYIVAN